MEHLTEIIMESQLPSLEETFPFLTEQHDSHASLVLKVAYNGAPYSGFAKQKDLGIPTVQRELESALGTLFRHPVDTVCAGRTDAGVHALGQVVSCGLARAELVDRAPHKLMTSLNALTPDDIAIKKVGFSDPDFSARFDAVRREYRYRIVMGGAPPLFLGDYAWWHRRPLDVDAMEEGASYLLGEHDFKSFCKSASAVGKNTVREIEEISFATESHLGEACLTIRVVGNAFLHSMIRTIVGTLANVGCGRRDPSWVGEVLAARDRRAAGENAPAQGLTFWHVDYPEGRIRAEL